MSLLSQFMGFGGSAVGDHQFFQNYSIKFTDARQHEWLRAGVIFVPASMADYAEAAACSQTRAFLTSGALQASGGSFAYGVASDGNLTVVESTGSQVQRTTDGGTTWTTGIAHNLASGTARSLATDGAGNWLLAGNTGSAFYISKSIDNGATWASVATPAISGSSASTNTIAIGWDSKNSLWVAAMQNTNAAQCIWTSPDGVTWTARAITTAFASDPTITASALGVLVFDTGATTNYAYSTNGTTYTTGTLPANKTGGYYRPVMFDSIAYSSGRGTYSTTDLANWTSVGLASPDGLRDPAGSVGGNAQHIVKSGYAYGVPSTGDNRMVRLGPDGLTEHFHVAFPAGTPRFGTVGKLFPMSNGILALCRDSGNYNWYRAPYPETANVNAIGAEGVGTINDLSAYVRIK